MCIRDSTRRSIAELRGLQPSGADRLIPQLCKFPGVEKKRIGREVTLVFNADAAQPAPSDSALVAACLGTSLSRVFDGSAYEQAMKDALAYVLKKSKEQRGFSNVDRKFFFVPQGGEIALPEKSAVLDDLIRAVLDAREVTLDYQHFDGRQEGVTIKPLTIAIYDHQVYVIGRRPSHPAYPYRLARIQAVSVGKKFSYPSRASYDPDQVFRQSLGIFITDNCKVHKITLRLDPVLAVHARTHRWHPSQRTEEQADGGHLLYLEVRVCPELEMFILGLGERAEVVKPKFLRKRIARRAALLAELYSG